MGSSAVLSADRRRAKDRELIRYYGLNCSAVSRISGFEFQANIRNNNREGKPNKPEGEFTHVNNQNLSPYGKRRPN